MEYIDTHCHPHFDDFLPDPEKILADAAEAGVGRMIAVGTTLADSQKAIDFAGAHKNVWASAGVHPHDAAAFLADATSPEKLKQLLNKSSTHTPKNKFSGGPIVAIGEIGLDFYKNYSPKQDQIDCLKRQIEIGLPLGLPFIFHIRDAWDDFWPLFDSYSGIKGVIHSFSSNEQQLENALTRDLYIGLNGIMTFTKDGSQLEAAKEAPLNKMLLETDAPFLTPKPFRGQTCEPKHIVTVAEFLAELRGEELEELATATTTNAVELFGLDQHE